MKTIETTVYSYSELSASAQQVAREKFSDINTDSDWSESVYEDFKMFAETLGVSVDLKKTYFSGFYHQGSGSSFTAAINVLEFIDGVNGEKWKEHAPLDEPGLSLIECTPAHSQVDRKPIGLH